ncbi:TorD/DmsD family molecular chaperone [Campylobacter concisus]|uniref:Formate dehydrogenase-specific chaperone n=1 Tax=Campylobacter concisus TaxID=199 RepID=A0A2R4NY53_9BACT|nr:molecular chaperone TorD family protein [Campylobacter concisus]AVX43362.1 Putative formate dehydrogenase-specific chaperone [Campylobacter concisus]
MDKNITKARAYFYEFLAYPLFFHTSDEKFARWREQLSYLAQNPLSEQSAEAFANLEKFSFKELVNEQNEVLFGFTNIPLSASFYEEGRDNGAARLRVIHCLNLSPYRRDKELCKDSEDYVGFIFLAMATFLNDEFNGAKNISDKLFIETLNLFIDEFGSLLLAHKNANFFHSYAIILQDFIELERAVLSLEAPAKPQGDSVAVTALKKEPYQSKMPTFKTKLHWEEFSPVISHEFKD